MLYFYQVNLESELHELRAGNRSKEGQEQAETQQLNQDKKKLEETLATKEKEVRLIEFLSFSTQNN